LKGEWKALWRERIDDRVRAEGIANRDYPRLEVERGLVIVATRDYKPLDFVKILQRHSLVSSNPSVGGWGKFIRDVISNQKRFTKRGRPVPSKPEHERQKDQQCKKGGRGWLHVRM
jgi:hypothetical protein